MLKSLTLGSPYHSRAWFSGLYLTGFLLTFSRLNLCGRGDVIQRTVFHFISGQSGERRVDVDVGDDVDVGIDQPRAARNAEGQRQRQN